MNNLYEKDLFKQLTRTPRSIEPIGIIPRSILRTLQRFFRQILMISTDSVIAEFRISRYQLLISLQALISLIFIPLLVHSLAMTFFLTPATAYLWNSQQEDIFLNSSLEQHALQELQHFEEELYFDYFASPTKYETPIWAMYQIEANLTDLPLILNSRLQEKMIDLAQDYNQKSIMYLTTLFGDLVTIATVIFVILGFKAQMIIFKSFILEFLYSLSDTIKSVLLIFSTNLLVGFHSPRGWELLLEVFLSRFGFPPSEHFVLLFVASFPVLLDTIFKYWIFRYLNKISPSTVATYHAMLE